MRPFLAAASLIPVLLPVDTSGAQASPFLAPALSQSELAANSAGQSIAIRFEGIARIGQIALTGTDLVLAGNLLGIRTIALDKGASSLTEAVTSLAVKATLTDAGPRPGF
jgi:hypothetical protein